MVQHLPKLPSKQKFINRILNIHLLFIVSNSMKFLHCRGTHTYASVQERLIVLQLHRLLRYPVKQLHDTISPHAFGLGGRDMNCGASLSLTIAHPISVTSGSCWIVTLSCIQIILWLWARLMWNRSASLVGGRASGSCPLHNIFTRVLSQVSVVGKCFRLALQSPDPSAFRNVFQIL